MAEAWCLASGRTEHCQGCSDLSSILKYLCVWQWFWFRGSVRNTSEFEGFYTAYIVIFTVWFLHENKHFLGNHFPGIDTFFLPERIMVKGVQDIRFWCSALELRTCIFIFTWFQTRGYSQLDVLEVSVSRYLEIGRRRRRKKSQRYLDMLLLCILTYPETDMP